MLYGKTSVTVENGTPQEVAEALRAAVRETGDREGRLTVFASPRLSDRLHFSPVLQEEIFPRQYLHDGYPSVNPNGFEANYGIRVGDIVDLKGICLTGSGSVQFRDDKIAIIVRVDGDGECYGKFFNVHGQIREARFFPQRQPNNAAIRVVLRRGQPARQIDYVEHIAQTAQQAEERMACTVDGRTEQTKQHTTEKFTINFDETGHSLRTVIESNEGREAFFRFANSSEQAIRIALGINPKRS